MAEKHRKIYQALIDGATEGLSGKPLYEFVAGRCPKLSSKKLVRASLLALTDPHVTDRNILNTIYALAIKHRMAELGGEEVDNKSKATTRSRRKSTEASAELSP